MKVHFVAIGGAVMHNLAIALKLKGEEVTGSDDAIFDPSRSHLSSHGLLPLEEGWYPERIHPGLDAVILGMHARKDNPELIRAQELGIHVYSFPEFLYEQYKEKTRVVIAGSHGKTSITAMVLHALHNCGLSPDYMVGARLDGFDVMVRLTHGDGIAVLEGDEYLSSPLDPRPKFLHYKPHITLLSGIAWDHINVFPTEESYIEQFRLLLENTVENGLVVYCDDDPILKKLVELGPKHLRYVPYRLPTYKTSKGTTTLLSSNGEIPLQIFGKHNLLNMSGAMEVCKELGVTEDLFLSSIQSFKGAARRLQLIAKKEDSLVFRDFAHAPSKLKATVEAVREQYPDHEIQACMELHTFSSLNKAFLPQYMGSMDQADKAMVFYHPHTLEMKRLPLFSAEEVRDAFGRKDMQVVTEERQLEQWFRGLSTNKTCLLIMSSGSYHGLDITQILHDKGYEII